MSERGDIRFVETPEFQKWMRRKGYTVCHGLKREGLYWYAELDGPGVFAPTWRKIPFKAWPCILKEQQYVLVKPYLSGDVELVGKTCVVIKILGIGMAGLAVRVRFEDGVTEAFPFSHLRALMDQQKGGARDA